MSPRSEFLAGMRAQLPILLGVIPFGLIYGVLARGAGIPAVVAQAMSSVVFAGSAQFIGTQLIASLTPAAVIVLTTFVVNLRHALYSASLAPYLQSLPGRWKVLLAYLLTDEAYAPTVLRFREHPDAPHRHWFLFGTGLTLWASWQASTAAGIFLGAQIPPGWSLDFALPLTFTALVVPSLTRRPAIASAVVAGLIAVLAVRLPYRLGLMAAAFGGILTGLVLEGLAKAPERQ